MSECKGMIKLQNKQYERVRENLYFYTRIYKMTPSLGLSLFLSILECKGMIKYDKIWYERAKRARENMTIFALFSTNKSYGKRLFDLSKIVLSHVSDCM